MSEESDFHVFFSFEKKMEKLEKIGYGAYGNTFSVSYNGKVYALKQNLKSNELVGTSVIREMSTLILLKGHPNIVNLSEVFRNRPCDTIPVVSEKDGVEDKIYFLFEIANFDLHTFIYVLNSPINVVMKIMVDVALALEFMHSKGFVHRDIKPGNILVTLGTSGKRIAFNRINSSNKALYKTILNEIDPMEVNAKLCDFGFSKVFSRDSRSLTPGVVTMWYRAPEIVMTNPYDEKIDVWSYGLLFYEILFKSPLYDTTCETDESELISKIIRKRPCLDGNDKKYLSISDDYLPCGIPFNRERFVDMTKIDTTRLRKIEDIIGDGSLEDVETFIKTTLEIDPSRRPSMTTILDSPIFSKFRSYIAKSRRSYDSCRTKFVTKVSSSPYKEMIYNYFKIILDNVIRKYNVSMDKLFLAVDILERYLTVKGDDVREDFILYACISSFYIAFKYYASFIKLGLDLIVSPFGITLSNEIISTVENVEIEILTELGYQVYADTAYIFIDENERDDVDKILIFMLNYHPGEYDPVDIAINFQHCHDS